MRTLVFLPALLGLALVQAGCSERTQDASKATADSAVRDAEANMQAAGDVLQAGAAEAADKVSEGAADLRDKIDEHKDTSPDRSNSSD